MRLDHRRVGFLGVHTTPEDRRQVNHWSALLEAGWAETMRVAGQNPDSLAFRASAATDHRKVQITLAEEAARPLVARRDITAVVCASTTSTEGLLAAVRADGTYRCLVFMGTGARR